MSCSLPKYCHSHKHPSFFLSDEDAEDLWKALNGNKTDTATIINILAKRTQAQRFEIVNSYRKLHDANLVDDLKAKLSGDFKNLIVAMMTPTADYYAEELHYAVDGPGTDESDLIEILCTLTNEEIKMIRRSYHQKYDVYLEDDIKDDTSGNFKELLVALCRTERNENMPINQQQASADAEALLNATNDDKWSIFSDILIHRSFEQLCLTFSEYEKIAGTTIEKAVEDAFSSDVQEGLLAIIGAVKNPAAFFAKKFHQSMAGLGTRDRDLVRLTVTRSERDIEDIKKEYAAQYSETLAAAIADDTSGDYKTCLLTLIGEE